jgi:hypothetical protein
MKLRVIGKVGQTASSWPCCLARCLLHSLKWGTFPFDKSWTSTGIMGFLFGAWNIERYSQRGLCEDELKFPLLYDSQSNACRILKRDNTSRADFCPVHLSFLPTSEQRTGCQFYIYILSIYIYIYICTSVNKWSEYNNKSNNGYGFHLQLKAGTFIVTPSFIFSVSYVFGMRTFQFRIFILCRPLTIIFKIKHYSIVCWCLTFV